jgi:hypothetical protein
LVKKLAALLALVVVAGLAGVGTGVGCPIGFATAVAIKKSPPYKRL